MSSIKLLLDENLSPSIALALRQSGSDAVHVRDRGMTGRNRCRGPRGRVCRGPRELHAGIILVEEGDLVRDEQERVILEAIDAIGAEVNAGRDVVNRVLRIGITGARAFSTVPP